MNQSESRRGLAPHPVLRGHYAAADERVRYIRSLFDSTASMYDRINSWMSLRRGDRYRLEAMQRIGVQPGQRVLDCACGTGVMAAHARALVGDKGEVLALDPSLPMLAVAGARGVSGRVAGIAERLPLPDACIDVVTMGYALRHVSDLGLAFGEFARVLRPGGRLLILEMVPPRDGRGYLFAKLYLKYLVPALASVVTGSRDARRLMRYYWDSVDQCVPPDTILAAMRDCGFADVRRTVKFGLLNEYAARLDTPGAESLGASRATG